MASQSQAKETVTSTPPVTEKELPTPSAAPVVEEKKKWHVYVETEDDQTFSCGIYETVTEDDAIALGKQRVKKDNYEATIKIKRYFTERTTG
jgi:hypothetical protein